MDEEILETAEAAEETAEVNETVSEEKPSKKQKEPKETKKLKEEIEKIKAESKEQIDLANDKYLRLVAEYDNYKKRTSKELDARYQDAKLNVLTELLSVIDNFERAMNAESTDAGYKEGVELIFKQFIELLSKQGVEEIEAEGKEFDPNMHNAVMHVDDENFGPNTVCEVFQKGYKMGDKVLRHSLVKVAN